MTINILKMQGITKKFGAFKANDNINLEVKEGEIHALLGENGAGKSTLMNILYGLYTPTSGEIFIRDKKVIIDSPLIAIELGIGMIHQHFMLIPAFTVLENVILGSETTRGPFLDLEESRARVIEIAEKHSLQVYPDVKVSSLSVGLQQQVEIIKALYRNADLLILDEPTGVLTPQENVELFETLKSLAKNGHSIIFISHKLDEVLEISDRISVLRRGQKIATVNTKDVSKQELAKLMVGREVVFNINKAPSIPGKELLQIKNLCVTGERMASTLKKVSFSVREGEIVGIAGVDGNGQTELIEAIAGLRKVDSGQIIVNGVEITNKTPNEILEQKVCLIPEDRKEVGSVKEFNLAENAILRNHYKKPFVDKLFINFKEVSRYTESLLKEYDVRAASNDVRANMLSGGNLQKLILAREIKMKPQVLLAMHPTRGLDVGAIEFIQRKLLEQRSKGVGILLVSTELEEIMNLSDRIVVMCNGIITGILEQKDATIELIGQLMAGETQSALCEVVS